MHAIEKILAKNSGRAEVHTGEIVTAKVDFAEINDLYLQTVYSFYEMGGEKVWNRERAARRSCACADRRASGTR